MMENLQVYYDVEAGVYRLLDDTEEDSGVEDLPFSTYNTMSVEETKLSAEMLLESERQANLAPDMDYLIDEDFYKCMDDDYKDDDYKPNQSFYQPKKSKSSKHYRKHNKENSSSGISTMLFTPKKQTGTCYETGSDSSSVRHYARKDRTPRTILKMMQKHRESERVRHHSLNRAMKEVCLRVPGYDPNAKETKVIQMQRIIGYECLLENTLTDLCAQLDIPTKHLRMNTHFITDAMRDTPLDEFYKPSRFKMSDVEEDEFDNVMVRKRRAPSSSGRQMLKDMDETLFKYRREKISSPTVDSTTDNVCQFFPTCNISNIPASQVAESSQESCFPSCLINMATSQTAESSQDSYMSCQIFRPIKTSQGMSSQESGIKVEHSSEDFSIKAEIEDGSSLHDEIETLIDQGLCQEPEHLKTVTASFMRDEMVPTSTYAEDETCGFDLSSPVRASQKVFMCSPRSSRDWFQPDDVDTPHGKEMQTVSPENVLETKPKLRGSGNCSPELSLGEHWGQTCDLLTNHHGNYPSDLGWNEPGDHRKHLGDYQDDQFGNAAAGLHIGGHHKNGNVDFCETADGSGCLENQICVPASLVPSDVQSTMTLKSMESSTKQRCVESTATQSCIESSSEVVHTPVGTTSMDINHTNIITPRTSSDETRPSLPKVYFTKESGTKTSGLAGSKKRSHIVRIISQGSKMGLSPAGRNKRKRYLPLRSINSMDQGEWSDSEEPKIVRRVRRDTIQHIGNLTVYSSGTAVADCSAESAADRPVVRSSSECPEKVDYRRSSWMNGFMMFCQINRSKFASANPGVNNSQIQRVMGHVWRTMSPDEQAPFEEKALKCSNYVNKLQQTSPPHASPESYVDSSTEAQTVPM